MSETASEKYLRNRAAFRERATADFLTGKPGVDVVLATANELVASMVFVISGKNLAPIARGKYIGDLLVSFCRSHFIAAELLLQGELIETATILRKQMELVSRLNELSGGMQMNDLVGKTPNVRHLRDGLRKLYGEYSEIAHSSNPRSLQLLGEFRQDGRTYTPLYPVFDKNLYAALSHLALVTVDFFSWTADFFDREFPDYDPAQDRSTLEKLATRFAAAFEGSKDA